MRVARGGLAGLALVLALAGGAWADQATARPLPRPVLAKAAPLVTLLRPRARLPVVAPHQQPVQIAAAPRPAPRPAAATLPAAAEPAVLRGPVIRVSSGEAPPRPRPGGFGQLQTVAAAVVPLAPATGGIVGRKGALCGDPALKGRTIPPIAATMKGCGLDEGVEVTSVAGIPLSQPAITDCTTATTFSAWVQDRVVPAVGQKGGGLKRIDIAASYVCRPRNNQRGSKVSEHGKGHALDVSGLELRDGSTISVLRDWGKGKAGRILKEIRVAACGPFSTVLGPGSDRFHRDHLHIDTARGRGPYCH